eukprot:36609_1
MSTREERSNLSVHGYVRQNICIMVPNEIIDLCMLFYFNKLAFRANQHGYGLVFMDDDTTVKSTQGGDRTCVFGTTINSEQCDKFEICFEWISTAVSPQFGGQNFMFGYLTSTIDKSIQNWNDRLGWGLNKYHSKGIFCGKIYDTFYLYHAGAFNNLHGYKCDNYNQTCSEGNMFKLIFSFIEDKVSVYHNNSFVHDINLDQVKEIIVAVTLMYTGQTIKANKWIFYKDDKTWS